MEQLAKDLATEIRENYDVMFVLGIGGSYAGSKAAIDFLETDFPVKFIGQGFETQPMDDLWNQYQDQRIKLCVISKSGGTFEITVALEYMEQKFRQKYGKDYAKHIIAITGNTGKLHDYATRRHIQTLLHPDVGGRYSVLTIVGLFPMAVAGIDTDAMEQGAEHMRTKEQNLIDEYVANRLAQYGSSKRVEVFAVSSAKAEQFGKWYQQLFGESEGKYDSGMWTSVLVYSRDLHSMGQFIQQGSPIICETIINVIDRENKMFELNQICINAVVKAHAIAGIKVLKIDLGRNPYDLGRLFSLFLEACVPYCMHLGVDPYTQPGVEAYKNEMRKLLNNGKSKTN